ncbi:substrate-binding domain-containing protein, partial [Acinetobacter baumannii]
AAIVVCPADTRGIGPAIERANSANIPVFTADIAAQGGRVVAHIASDNVEGGRLAARYIAQALNGQGKVGIIGQPEVQSTIDRERG